MRSTSIVVFFLAAFKTASCLDSHIYRSVAYYVNWAIYARKFNPQDLPVDKITHVLYAFANILPDTGEVYLSDISADTEVNLSGDSSDENGTNLYGCLQQFYLLKKANRNLKVLLSIGGSTYSSNFATPASTSSGRSTFASTAVSLIANLGLDGLDINWENLTNNIEAANLVLLLQTVREALDAYGDSLSVPYNFTLTAASPAGPSNYQALNLADMDQYIDFWNLMAYDYAGSWSTLAASQANLFSSKSDLGLTPFDTETAINYYTSQGIAPNKIVLGMPVYGRSFEATEGLGKPFNGVGNGTWEAGIYDFKALPLSGATVFSDNTTGSSYSYDTIKKELVSYDTVLVAKQKAAWIQQMGLGGAMWWESSADGAGNNSLIQNVVKVLGGDDSSGLEYSRNQLLYPNSTYDNLRSGMPNYSSSSSDSFSSTTAGPTMTTLNPSACAISASVSVSASTSTSTSLSSTMTSASQSSSITPSSLSSESASGLFASSVSNTSTTNCNYQTQRSTCSPSSSITLTIIATNSDHIFYTSTVPGPLGTVTAIVTVSIRGAGVPGCDSTSKPTTASIVVPACLSRSALTTAASSTFPSSADILVSSAYSSESTSSIPSSSPPNVAIAPSSKSSSCLRTSCSAAISKSSATQSSSTSAQTSYSSDLSSSTSSSHPSTTIPSSTIPSQLPLLSTTSSTEPSTSSADCAISGTCSNYKVLACPSGKCACAQDVNNVPTCFLDEDCATLLNCKTSADCSTSKACIVNTCCGSGGYCAQIAVGCLTSPAWTSTAQVAPICRKIKNRSILALGGGGIGSRLRC